MSDAKNFSRASAKIRVLVIDDEPAFTAQVKQALEGLGLFEVRGESCARLALATAVTFKPDIILIDVIMPDLDGSQVAAQIRAHEALREVPIIFLTVLVSEERVRLHRGVMEGEQVIAKPVRMTELAERIVRCLGTRRERPARKPVILVVDDEADFTRLLKLNLEATGRYHVVEENLDTCALATAHSLHPDLILVDVIMPHLNGADLIAQVKADETLRDVPVILMTALVSPESAEAPSQLVEGCAWLAKPFSLEALVKTIDQCLGRAEAGVPVRTTQ